MGRLFFGRYLYKVYLQGVPGLSAVYVNRSGSRAFERVRLQCYWISLTFEGVPGLYYDFLTRIDGDRRVATWL